MVNHYSRKVQIHISLFFSIIMTICLLFVFSGKVYAEDNTIVVDGFEYSVSGGTATLVSYKGTKKGVVVPSKVNGIPIKAINQGAFYDNDIIESIIFSEGLEFINPEFAIFCHNLQYIYIPSTTNVDGCIITECPKVKTIELS
ncbi:MAG: hypothetical protein K6C35_00190 [Eubacterium sp.]|nr:hypothetical protein [Eubacterium sp.]